ncbi:serine hydrolase [Lacinutrix sp. WUR7]|uniref:serine hydrolase domain-containing protein n=1 Tax=Lacinutrix sp. WUR7 TaxID=2653681 RepID=UPI00193DD38C|nr:serine hydrolase domain-containing protein [Lacinutrix sp. WUR7]QRM88479.1 serine hydrolase [Lacinutrix sp. WUR7]
MRNLKQYPTIFCLLICAFLSAQNNYTSEIDQLLEKYQSADAPGLSVKVISGNESIYAKDFGLANLDYDIKNSDTTIFSLASIGKQFTASAIWVLVKEGKIRLEDDIRKYLPEFPEYQQPIKIKHLLNHTSGIRNYHALMSLSGFDYDKTYYDNNTVFALACKQKGLSNIPGEKVAYSNTNYTLLAIIVERISGQNLNEFLKAHILNPLQMDATFVRVENGKTIKNKAVGYQKQNNQFVYSSSNQLSYGAGSMGSSIKDMTIWMQMLNEQILEFKPLSQFLKTTEILNNGEKAKYARGIMIDNYKDNIVASHGGYSFGGRTQLITIVEKQLGIIVLTNLQSIDAPSIAYQILDILLSDENNNVAVTKEEEVFKQVALDKYTGDYKEINSDMTMQLFVENDTLKAKGSIGRSATSLLQFADNKFHRKDSQQVKYDFTPATTHDMVILFGGTPFYFKRATLIDPETVNSNDFVGSYFSEELDVTYHLFVADNVFKLSYKNNENISLHPIQLDEFGNNSRTLYRFTRDKEGAIIGMLLYSEGTIKDVFFKKEASINRS